MMLINSKKLSYVYSDGSFGIQNITFQIANNTKIGLLGANGAGKTTFALVLLGLLKPYDGFLSVLELEVISKNLDEIRRRVGLLFQEPDNQMFMPTLIEDVALGLLQRGFSKQSAESKAMELLNYFRLGYLASKYPGHLSLGQKRLVALAGVLAAEPDLLILDEPTSQLDARGKRLLIAHLEALPQSMLIISHDINMIKSLCNRVILFDKGKVVAQEETSILLNEQQLLRRYGVI